MANSDTVVVRNDGIMGGRPVFRGTRVQIDILFENLADGYSIDEILESFPTLDRADLQAALQQACRLLKQSAPHVNSERDHESSVHARVLR